MTPESDAGDARRQKIVAAAGDVFLRYGFARTTMADIARASGLTRPTLYLSFKDKEAVFHGVIRAMVLSTIADIRTGLQRQETLEQKLAFACETWVLGAYELTQQHPDARDLFDLAFLPVRESYEAFEDLVVEIIRLPLARSGLAVDERVFASMISKAIKGFRDMAQDNAQLCTLVRALALTVASALSGPPADRPAV